MKLMFVQCSVTNKSSVYYEAVIHLWNSPSVTVPWSAVVWFSEHALGREGMLNASEDEPCFCSCHDRSCQLHNKTLTQLCHAMLSTRP